jgi:hypothetical protein
VGGLLGIAQGIVSNGTVPFNLVQPNNNGNPPPKSSSCPECPPPTTVTSTAKCDNGGGNLGGDGGGGYCKTKTVTCFVTVTPTARP